MDMSKNIDDLYDLCETVSAEIHEANAKIRSAGGKLSGADLDYLDKLTHTQKSVLTSIAMIEADEGESEMMPFYGGGYRSFQGGGGGGGSNRGRSNRGAYRGRSNAQRRDSMGRFSRDDAKADMIADLQDMMQDAPDEQMRKKLQRFIGEIENV